MVLCLNMFDLFKEKIQYIPIAQYLQDYHGTTENDAADFLKQKFLSLNKKSSRPITTFFTNMTDTMACQSLIQKIIEIASKKWFSTFASLNTNNKLEAFKIILPNVNTYLSFLFTSKCFHVAMENNIILTKRFRTRYQLHLKYLQSYPSIKSKLQKQTQQITALWWIFLKPNLLFHGDIALICHLLYVLYYYFW